MSSKNLKNIITIIVCMSVSVGVIIYNIIDKDDKPRKSNSAAIEQAENNEVEEGIKESDLAADDTFYDDNASDNYNEPGNVDITVYLKNGDVLYNNDDIPLSYFNNLMLRIQKFCDLNYPDVVKEIEVDPDTVVVTDEQVIFEGNLKNGHYLTVTYDISKKQFTMSDYIIRNG